MTAIEAAIKFLQHDHKHASTNAEHGGLIRLPVADDLLDRNQVAAVLEALIVPIEVNRAAAQSLTREEAHPSYPGYVDLAPRNATE